MSTAAEEVLAQALKLDPADREMVAAELTASLQKDPGYDEYWDAEIKRRVEEADSGLVPGVPWETVMAELRERVANARLRVP
ncbi:MAG: addiction module component, family protein [Anaerolinea sp.]|nr:addiction module component, family protein [Anaerolinea sp.]